MLLNYVHQPWAKKRESAHVLPRPCSGPPAPIVTAGVVFPSRRLSGVILTEELALQADPRHILLVYLWCLGGEE